jgi:hypothetical protein
MWTDMSEQMAYLADMEDPYITYKNDYIETGWWIIKNAFDRGLVYEGYKILPYCPRCGTGLASHEVAQGYKDVKVNTLTCKFRRTGVDHDNEYFLAWTTTPWTLASNIALTVGPDVDYVKCLMKSGDNEGNLLWVAEALAGKAAGGGSNVDINELIDAFITHTASGTLLGGNYTNDRITKVGHGAFYEDTTLTGFSGPNVTTVEDYAFRGCSKLTSLNLPKATKAGVSAFYQVNVPNLSLPEVTTMGTYTFGGGTASQTITLPKLKIVQSNGFRQNTGVTKVFSMLFRRSLVACNFTS